MNQKVYLVLLTVAAAVICPAVLSAALTWDSIPNNGILDEGAGTWKANDVTYNNWSDDYGATNVVWPTAGDSVTFGLGASSSATYNITVDGTVNASDITFNGSRYTLNGGTVNLTGSTATITVVNDIGRGYFYSSISSDADTIVLNSTSMTGVPYSFFYGANTYTSTLQIGDATSVGYLCVRNSEGLSANSAGTVVMDGSLVRLEVAGEYNTPFTINGMGVVGSGGALHLYGNDVHINNTVTLATDSMITTRGSGTVLYTSIINGVIGESGGSRKLTIGNVSYNTSELVLSGVNTYTGGTELAGTHVTLDSSTGPALKGKITFVDPATSTWVSRLTFAQDAQLNTTDLPVEIDFQGTVADKQFVVLNGTTQTVAGLTCAIDGTSTINNASATPGKLVINTAGSSVYSYTGKIEDGSGGGELTLEKTGTGTQILIGPDVASFGKTVVSGGTLQLGDGITATPLGSTVIDVRGTGVLDLSYYSGGFTLEGSKTLLGSGGTVVGDVTNSVASMISGGVVGGPGIPNQDGTLNFANNLTCVEDGVTHFDLSNSLSTGNDLITVGGNLALNDGAIIEINLTNGYLADGVYRLFNYTGYFSGVLANLDLVGSASQGSRSTYDIIQDETIPADKFIGLDVTYVAPLDLLWGGTSTVNTWETKNVMDWKSPVSPPPSSPNEYFYSLDTVTFDNTGYGNVQLSGELIPGHITIADGTTQDYTFGGSGELTGDGGITKGGSGKLTIANTGGFSMNGDINLNEGTLAFQLSGDASVPSITGPGSLRMEGTGVLTLSGDNSGLTGSITIVSGTLNAGSETALGDASADTVINGGTLDVNGMNLSTEHVFVQGGGAGGNGAITSSSAGWQIYALNHVTVTGTELTLGCDSNTGRWDVRGTDDEHFGDLDDNLNPEDRITLTKKGVGTVGFSWCNVTSKLGDINIEDGMLTFDGGSTMGDMTKTVTISSGGTFSFWAPGYEITRPIVSNGGRISNEGGGSTPVVLSGPITINGDTTISTVSGTVTEITAAITGTSGLVKQGSGILRLQGGNMYAGTTTLDGGTLVLDSASGYAVPHNLIYGDVNSTVVELNQGEENGGQAQMSPDATITFSATASSQYLRMHGHQLTVEGIDGLASSDGQYAIENYGDTGENAVLIIDNASPHSYRGKIRDNGGTLALVKRGTGTMTILGADSGGYTGGLTIEEGTLSLDDGMGVYGTLPAKGLVQITGGTLDIGSSYHTIAAFQMTGGLLNGFGYLTNDTTDFDLQAGTINAVLDGTVGLTKTGPGTVTLTNYNNYYGPTKILEGTLALSGSASLNSSINIQLAGGVFDVSGLYSPYYVGTQTLSGDGVIRGSLSVSSSGALKPGTPATAGTLAIQSYGASNGDLDMRFTYGATLGFKLSDDAAGASSDQLTVAGAWMADSASVTLQVHALDAAYDTSQPYTLMTFGPSTNLSTSLFTFTNDTRYSYTLSLTGGTTGTPTSGALQIAYSGTGPKVLTWNDANGFNPYWDNTKTTTVWKDSGNNDEQFYELDAVVFDNNSTYSSVTIFGMVYPSSVTVNNDASHNYAFNDGGGKISGVTGISKSGAGSLSIYTNNDFAGEVAITDGTIIIGTPNALGDTVGGTVVSGSGALDLQDIDLATDEVITISGTGYSGQGTLISSVPSSSPSIGHLTLAGDASVGGNVGTLYVTGAGDGSVNGNGHTLTKIGANTFLFQNVGETNFGDLVVNEGRLYFWGDSTLGNGTVTIDNVNAGSGGNAQLVFRESSVVYENDLIVGSNGGQITLSTLGTVTFNGAVGSNSGTLNGTLTTSVSADDTLTLGHNLSGPAGLSNISAGTLVLTGNNTYSGTTTVSAGYLNLQNTTGGSAIPGNMDIAGTGSNVYVTLYEDEQIADSAVLTFSNSANYARFLLNGHTETVAGISCSDERGVIQDGNLIVNNTDDYFYNGYIRYEGTVTKLGPGTLTLSGVHIYYYDGTTVSEGKLVLQDTTRDLFLPTTIVNNAELAFDTLTANVNFSGPISGSGTLQKTGPNTLTLSGANSCDYTGVTLIDEGLLQLDTGTSVTLAGGITGDGDLSVLEGTSLTSPSITVGTLTIGGSSAVAASTQGTAPVPEPATWCLLLIGLLSLTVVRLFGKRR
ncbi:MAG: autotransporter-associated beta strand repeat-containing protein [Pirellulales bacterium]|nr:autotransporter-associated beta strand repeat-containing protein [Pirellulales bacterium]